MHCDMHYSRVQMKKKSKSKTKVASLGVVDISDDEFHPQNVKVRVTTMLDEDALAGLKEIANERGLRYQTLLNKLVRSYVFTPQKSYEGRSSVSESDVRKIVREELKKRRKD